MGNNYKGVTPLRKKRNKITLNAAIVLCIIVFIIGILCGKAGSSNKQNEEAAKRIQEIEQEYEVEIAELQKLNETFKKENKDLNGKIAAKNAEIEKLKKANQEAEAAVQEVGDLEVDAEEQELEDIEEATPQKSGSVIKTIIVICLIIVVVLCILLGVSIILKKNNDDDEEYEDFDDDIEYIEENYKDENE